MYAGIWFITTDIDVLWIFCTAEFCHDIFWKVDQDRAGAAGSCDIKSFFNDAAEIFTVADSDSVFCNATCNADNVNFLKSIISDQMTCNLSGEADKCPVTRLVAPGPLVTRQTPTFPVVLA